MISNIMKVSGLVSCAVGAVSAQSAEFSPLFLKTVKKISNEYVQRRVETFLAEKNPVLGIAGKDLIGQVIQKADKQEVAVSALDAAFTGLFVYRVQSVMLRDEVSAALLDSNDFSGLGWDRHQIVAYSALYIYYSERLKYDLPVSFVVLNMEEVREKVESLQVTVNGQRRKWTVHLSTLIAERKRVAGGLVHDVRAYELIKREAIGRIQATGAVELTLRRELVRDYLKRGRDSVYFVGASRDSLDYQGLLAALLDEKSSGSLAGYASQEMSSLTRQILQPVSVLLKEGVTEGSSKFESLRYPDYAVSVAGFYLKKWLEQANADRWFGEYRINLAASILPWEKTANFSVMDQARFGYRWGRFSVYGFVGGLIDPFIKSLADMGVPYYTGGAGVGFGGWNVAFTGSLPVEKPDLGSVLPGFMVGYEIPLQWLSD